MHLSWVFMQSFQNCMTKLFPGRPGFCRRIFWQICDNLTWWNNLVSTFNSVLIFEDKREEIQQLYTDKLLIGPGDFYYKPPSNCWTDVIIEENTTFVAIIENCKSGYQLNKSRESMICVLPQDLNVQLRLPISIYLFKMLATLLRFQLQAEKLVSWRVIVSIDSKTGFN